MTCHRSERLYIYVVQTSQNGGYQVHDMIQQRDWLCKLHLKNAYFTIFICTVDQKYLRFPWEGKVYLFQCLPFWTSLAPWLFRY